MLAVGHETVRENVKLLSVKEEFASARRDRCHRRLAGSEQLAAPDSPPARLNLC